MVVSPVSPGPVLSLCSTATRGPAEQGGDVGPELLPLLALGLGQLFESGLVADTGEVAVRLPVPHLLPDRGVDPRVALVEQLAPVGQVGAEPVEGLPAPACTLLGVELVGILALTATGPGGPAGGVV